MVYGNVVAFRFRCLLPRSNTLRRGPRTHSIVLCSRTLCFREFPRFWHIFFSLFRNRELHEEEINREIVMKLLRNFENRGGEEGKDRS